MLSSNRNLLFKAIILALCIISCVHLFLFPLFETHNNIKTYLDLEQSLCDSNIRKRSSLKMRKCPHYGIITVMQGGRLGNQMWEYASVWALARKTGLEPYVPRCIKVKLELLFDKLSLSTLDDISHCSVQTDFSINSLEAWNFTNQSIILPRCARQHELISTWVQDIVQEFRIKKSLLHKSQRILQSATKFVNKSFDTFIGIHVRRTDYFSFLEKNYNTAVFADVHFFTRAMEYFENNYPNPIFIFVSDDPVWCWKTFKSKKNVYVTAKRFPNSPELDMAILASCNHTIFDYGNFGEWGAILAGGETIYFNVQHFPAKFGILMKNWHTL